MAQNDEFARHEILHMSHFLGKCVNQELLEHSEIQNNPEWKELADTACEALNDLYQKIGAAS